MARCLGCVAFGIPAGIALFAVAAYVVLVYGPDTSISF